MASTIGQINPFRYRGYYYDNETELYYLQSRYYNPEICRMLNADDTSILLATQGELLGANLFAYCGNNPVMYSDPSGYGKISITMKRDFLRDLLTAGATATATVSGWLVASAIASASGGTLSPFMGLMASAIGEFFGWVFGGTISRTKINKAYHSAFGCRSLPGNMFIIRIRKEINENIYIDSIIYLNIYFNINTSTNN